MASIDVVHRLEGRQVVRRGGEHVLEFRARLVEPLQLNQRTPERDAGREVGGMPLEPGPADTHRFLEVAGAAAQQLVVGALLALADTGARVIAHAAEIPWIGGERPPVGPGGWLGKLMTRLVGTAEPTKVDQLITADGSEPVPGFTALHTPGHTRGHVSFLLERAGGVLFAGDAAGSNRGRVSGPPRVVTADFGSSIEAQRPRVKGIIMADLPRLNNIIRALEAGQHALTCFAPAHVDSAIASEARPLRATCAAARSTIAA